MNDIEFIKQRFVAQVLRKQAQEMLQLQEATLRKKLNFHTGVLMERRAVNVSDGNGSMDGRLSFRHVDYERFLDIRLKIMKKEGGYKNRNLRIHNRFVMGCYYSIAKNLMFGFTEQVRENLKRNMQMTIPFID